MKETAQSRTNGLQALLEPKSIAIIGASNDPGKISGRPIHLLKKYGFEGHIFPVNKKRDELQGLTCYSSILDIPYDVDLAIIALSGQYVVSTLEDCAQKQVKSCVIFSSGFAEMGEEGKAIQNQMSHIAKESGMRIVGPNCQGVANLKINSFAAFPTPLANGDLHRGSSAILSQSGAVAGMVYNIGKEYGQGIKYWISTGNEADVSVPELIQYAVEDPDVQVIQAYIEDMKDSKKLLEAAVKANQARKPVLVLKPGRTEEAKQAASSHTGALAAEDHVLDAVFNHYGLIRVDDVIELSAFSQIFKQTKVPKGKKVAILTNSGGLGVMMVDKCKEYGLEISRFSENTLERLKDILPEFASVNNPIDITAQLINDATLFSRTVPILMEDANVDAIVLSLAGIGKGYDIPRILDDIIKTHAQSKTIISVAWVGTEKGTVLEEMGSKGVPIFADPTLCIKGLSKYIHYHTNIDSAPKMIHEAKAGTFAQQIVPFKTHTDNGYLSEADSKQLLTLGGLPLASETLAHTVDEACEFANKIGYPVVTKVSSAKIQHKSEIGVVQLNIQSDGQLKESFEQIFTNAEKHVGRSAIDGVLVQEMVVEDGFEISLGLKNDPVFGPIIMVASGGIYIEVLKDFQLLIPPVTVVQARVAVDALSLSALLYGARGKANLDVDALCQTIVAFSDFVMQAADHLEEVDLNPVMVLEEGKGVKIVDALIKLKEKEKK